MLFKTGSKIISICWQFFIYSLNNNIFLYLAEKGNDVSLERLCGSVSNLANEEPEKLQIWLKQIILGATNISPNTSSTNIQSTITTANA